MPLYDFVCGNRHVTERRASYETDTIACMCGLSAHRVAVYPEQFTITETGSVSGARDRVRRDHMGEKLRRLEQSSHDTTRESGSVSGPFKVPERKTYG